jgi:hypothetical protein
MGGRPPMTGTEARERARTELQDEVPPWLLLLTRQQFELNCLASVSIEVPALRPAFERLKEALGE